MARLTDRQDAFGHALYDYHLGGGPAIVIERDDGYVDADFGGELYLAGVARWPASQRRAIKLARGRTLDVGCGAGRVALHLQEQGHGVVAVDTSPLAVKTCRERGVEDARALSVTQVSRKLGRFDTIVMYGNNFGLFGSFRRARWLLRRFRNLTSPDARIIAETRNPYGTDDPYHTAYHRLNRRRGRMGGQIKMRVLYETHRTPWFDYLMVSREEMDAILAGTGWAVDRIFDGKHGTYVAVIGKE